MFYFSLDVSLSYEYLKCVYFLAILSPFPNREFGFLLNYIWKGRLCKVRSDTPNQILIGFVMKLEVCFQLKLCLENHEIFRKVKTKEEKSWGGDKLSRVILSSQSHVS